MMEELREHVREEIINTPETADFIAGVAIEAAHQRDRWAVDHDAGKTPFDWFWLIGYLAQKAADAATRGDAEKAMHHTISTAAALGNWHAALAGADTRMRPGIGPSDGGDKQVNEEPCEGGAHCCCCGPGEPCCDCGQLMPSRACVGEKCWCGAAAAKKIGEEILFDDPMPTRHNLTAYVCASHYAQMMGRAGAEQVGLASGQVPQ